MPVIDPAWLAKNHFEVARYAFDGEWVYVPVIWPDGVLHLVPAKVACAAGNHVRVVNEKRMLDRWYDVWDIYRNVARKS